MEEDTRGLGLDDLEVQIGGLRSGSTRSRIEILRNILKFVEIAHGKSVVSFVRSNGADSKQQTATPPNLEYSFPYHISWPHIPSTKTDLLESSYSISSEPTCAIQSSARNVSRLWQHTCRMNPRNWWLLPAMLSYCLSGALLRKKS